MPFLRERSGRWSPGKIVAFVGSILPALWLGWRALAGGLGARPFDVAIHDTGSWAVRLMLVALAVTPARRLFAAPQLINMRRTLGVAAFGYAALHLVLYIFDQKLDLAKVASEIVLRFYLTIGFIALIGLIALASTSTDGAIRRLGSERWNRLHKLVYAIAVLAIIHFLLQTKIDISESAMVAGFLVWLLGYRGLQRFTGNVTPILLVLLSIGAAAFTMFGEVAWYGLGTGVDPRRVLYANVDFSYTIRPAWWVLAAGLAVTLASLLWSFRPQRPAARRTLATASSGATNGQLASWRRNQVN